MPLSSNIYLIIPIDKELGNTDDRLLKDALDIVAKANNKKNKGKKYLSKKLGCTGNSVKKMMKMIKIKNYKCIFNYDHEDNINEDAYHCIRKLDKEKYADMINLIVEEYAKMEIPKEKKDELFEFINKYKISTPSYQTALCYKSIDGLQTVVFDPITANKINRIENAQDIAEKIINALKEKEVKIQP